MIERGPDGRFRSVPEPSDVFYTVEITNKMIYDKVEKIDRRLDGVERRMGLFHKTAALVVPATTTVASVITVWWYVR